MGHTNNMRPEKIIGGGGGFDVDDDRMYKELQLKFLMNSQF